MNISETYKKLNIHQKINARSFCMINRKTGYTPYSKETRTEHVISLNYSEEYRSDYNQPFYLHKLFVGDNKFIVEYQCKF